MKTFKSLAIAVSSLCVLPTVAHAKNVSPNDTGMAMMRLNASALSDEIKFTSNTHTNENKTYGVSVWNHLRNDFRMAEVNTNLVRSHEYKFATNSAYFNRTLNRSKPYMYHIVQEVKRRGMPAEIALLPFIESAYVTKASSHVGASGLWQFMPATGRHYGLEQTPLYDGRHDVYAATDAALNYLQYLHGLFGDWSLALAAYNWGEGNVTRAIRRAQASGIAPTYENIKMPAETRNYVPKLLAVRNLVRNPQAFGLSLPDIQNTPYFKAVTINSPVDIVAAAHLANISENEFLALNPAFKTPVFIPKSGRKMLLPIAAAKTFENNYKENNVKSLLSWDIFTPSYNMPLAEIAAQTGTDLSELRRLNGLNGTQVPAGRSILVAKNGKSNQVVAINFVSADKDTTPDTFVEQKQPVLTNFVANNAPAASLNHANAAPARLDKTTPTNFIVAQHNVPVADFKERAEPSNETNQAANNIAIDHQAIISKAELAKIDSEIQQNSQNLTSSEEVTPSNKAILLPEEVNLLAQNQNVATAPIDPLYALATERAQALKEARAAAARAKREAERAKAAARIAEAKEAKRKEQERLRVQNQKLKQAQELASRRVREANEPITVAIRDQQAAISTTTHRVKEGDTLFNIAQRYNLNVADLVNGNNLRGNQIRVGQLLKVSGVKNAAAQARSPMTKVSVRTAAVMGLSRDVSVSTVLFDSRGPANNKTRIRNAPKSNTKLIPS